MCFRVHGRVQGVGFRWWVLQHARALQLVGSVRNLPDGTVEVRAAGSPASLSELRRLLQEGPRAAAISRIVESSAPDITEDGFVIH